MVAWGRRNLEAPLERATLADAGLPRGLARRADDVGLPRALARSRGRPRARPRLLRPGGVLALSTGDAADPRRTALGQPLASADSAPPQLLLHCVHARAAARRGRASRSSASTTGAAGIRCAISCTSCGRCSRSARSTRSPAASPRAGSARSRVPLNLGDIATVVARARNIGPRLRLRGPIEKVRPSCDGLRKLGSAAQPRLLSCAGCAGAPPANPSLASGLVARWPDYRRHVRGSQVAQSSDS